MQKPPDNTVAASFEPGDPRCGFPWTRAIAAAAFDLRAIANDNRLLLLLLLQEGSFSVGDLANISGIGQPTLSQQLGVLRNTGLIHSWRVGRSKHYLLTNDGKRALKVARAALAIVS